MIESNRQYNVMKRIMPRSLRPQKKIYMRNLSIDNLDEEGIGVRTVDRGSVKKSKIVVVGQGYVGLPLAMRATEVGHHVIGFDIDNVRIKRIENGETFIEDVSSDQLAAALDSGRYLPSSNIVDCEDFDVAIISVPTPLRDGVPDLSYIEVATRELAPLLREGAVVILESTTYPGTTDELVTPILEEGSGLKAGSQFHVGYSPERIDPGNPVWNFQNTPKVVSGIDDESLKAVEDFYSDLVDVTIPVNSMRVAELTKLLENTFRHVNIALVNELAMFASQLGVSVWDAIDAANSKPYGFMRFTPGPGVGGHCLPIDPSYLSWKVERTIGESFRFIDLANDVNGHMPSYVVKRITHLLNREHKAVNGSRILIIGLAYKCNSGDLRESPSLEVCEMLANLGAEVRVTDSLVAIYEEIPWTRVELTGDEIERSDLVVILTDHDGVDYSAVASGAKLVFDTRRRLKSGPTIECL